MPCGCMTVDLTWHELENLKQANQLRGWARLTDMQHNNEPELRWAQANLVIKGLITCL